MLLSRINDKKNIVDPNLFGELHNKWPHLVDYFSSLLNVNIDVDKYHYILRDILLKEVSVIVKKNELRELAYVINREYFKEDKINRGLINYNPMVQHKSDYGIPVDNVPLRLDMKNKSTFNFGNNLILDSIGIKN